PGSARAAKRTSRVPVLGRLSQPPPDGPGEIAEGADAVGQEEILEPAQPGDRADEIDDVLDLDPGIAGMRDGLGPVDALRAQAHEEDDRVAEPGGEAENEGPVAQRAARQADADGDEHHRVIRA